MFVLGFPHTLSDLHHLLVQLVPVSIVKVTGVRVSLIQPPISVTASAKYVTVPTMFNIGLATTFPPFAASYQTTACPTGTVAVCR